MNDIAPPSRPALVDVRRALNVARLCADKEANGRLGVTLRVVAGRLTVAGQATDCQASIQVDGQLDGLPGALDLSPGPLAACLGSMKGELALGLHRASVVLDDGHSSAVLSGWEGRDPNPELDPTRVLGSIRAPDTEAVRTWIRQFVFAIAGDKNRYALNGAHIELVPGLVAGADTVRAIATDGNRLAIAELDGVEVNGQWPKVARPPDKDGKVPAPSDTLISRKALGALHSLLSGWGGPGPVELRWTDRYLEVKAGPVALQTRLLEADYPQWRQVLPQAYKRTVDLDRDALLAALRRVKWAAPGHLPTVSAHLLPGELSLVTRVVHDVGASSARTKVPIALEGESLLLGLNLVFLQDALRALPPGPVRFQLGDTLALVRVSSRVNTQAWSILMPVRLD